MDLSLEHRLIRFLDREDEDERRSHEDLRALPVDERVIEGECIRDAVFVETAGEGFVFEVGENHSKFRQADSLVVGDGRDFDAASAMAYGGYDAQNHRLTLHRDRFSRGAEPSFDAGETYCIDRRPIGARGRLRDVVRAGFVDDAVRTALSGELDPAVDAERMQRARATLEQRGLNPSQIEAGVNAIACEQLALVQGPPGTGKTRLLAEVLAVLCGAGCRIAVSAFTHRAVDNVLLALRRVAPQIEVIKLGYASGRDRALRKHGIKLVDPRNAARLPSRGVVVAGTSFALAKMPSQRAFHYTVFDEAAQLPIPHAIAGMLLSSRWVFLGDHRQLPPVITAEHADREVTRSIFEHLDAHYGSCMLEETYRMNEGICGLVSETFYDGALRSAAPAAGRTVPHVAGGTLDEVLSPEHPAVLARIDHLQPGKRSPEEANLAADLVADLVQRHGVAPAEIAIVAPFRAQVRAIRTALQRLMLRGVEDVTVDTVERIQGQEREVVLISLAVGDPDTLDGRAAFFFSTNRLNVALSRARTKVVLIASRGAFTALPKDPASLAATNVFRRLYQALPQVDLTAVYGGVGALRAQAQA